jgi:hypothetical protein
MGVQLGVSTAAFLLGTLHLAQVHACCPELERKEGIITLRLTTAEVGLVR